MAAIRRTVLGAKIPASQELAAADDLNGVSDGSKNIDVSGCLRVLVIQENDGTAGTAGIDVIEVSHDGGSTWAADDTLIALANDDQTGDVLANAALNAAGTEPTRFAVFKGGPYMGPTLMRCVRDNTVNANSAAWSTGAPSVDVIRIGA